MSKSYTITAVLSVAFLVARCAHPGADLVFDTRGGSSAAGGGNSGTSSTTTSTVSITGITASNADAIYVAGNTITIQVNFSGNVTVTGTPQLVLRTKSAATTNVNYAAGSGTTTLSFIYTVANGDDSADLDYDSSGALSGTIKDSGGLTVPLTLPAPGASGSLGANKNLIIDTSTPTVTNVTSPNANGNYAVGSVITIQVVFSETVIVIGTPRIKLMTNSGGPVFTFVNYTAGSGTNTLTFDYTVAPGDSNTDLEYQNSAALNLAGATIKDAAANNATLSLPTPGSAGSLGFNKNIAMP